MALCPSNYNATIESLANLGDKKNVSQNLDPTRKEQPCVVKNVDWILKASDTLLSIATMNKKGCKFNLDGINVN